MGKQRTLKKLTTPKSTPPGPSTSRSGIQKSNETADLSAVRRGIGRAIHEEYQQQLRDYCSRGELHRVDHLLVQGVDVNAPDALGRTPLHFAAVNGHLEVVKALISHSRQAVSLNSRDANGNTPLHLAVTSNHVPVVLILLEAGCDADALDKYERSAIDMARSRLDLIRRTIEESSVRPSVESLIKIEGSSEEDLADSPIKQVIANRRRQLVQDVEQLIILLTHYNAKRMQSQTVRSPIKKGVLKSVPEELSRSLDDITKAFETVRITLGGETTPTLDLDKAQAAIDQLQTLLDKMEV